MKTDTGLISIALVVAGFIAGALISEASLRGISNESRDVLFSAFSKLRLLHIAAILTFVAIGFFVPGFFWPAALVYFTLATVLAIRKLRGLALPERCLRMQALSVGVVFLGVASAAVVQWQL